MVTTRGLQKTIKLSVVKVRADNSKDNSLYAIRLYLF